MKTTVGSSSSLAIKRGFPMRVSISRGLKVLELGRCISEAVTPAQKVGSINEPITVPAGRYNPPPVAEAQTRPVAVALSLIT